MELGRKWAFRWMMPIIKEEEQGRCHYQRPDQ